jgi:hypothetical protein
MKNLLPSERHQTSHHERFKPAFNQIAKRLTWVEILPSNSKFSNIFLKRTMIFYGCFAQFIR